MFKTILKIAVLSATAMTLLSACGAAKKALNSAADDALNAALAKAEKRYEKRYTEAISNLIDENGDPLKVYIDENGNPFHVTIDENGNPIKVTIDDKINSIKAKTDDKGNPIKVTIDDKGNPTPVTIADKSNPIPVTIDDKSDPILTAYTAPTTAEICSGKHTWELWKSPCDNDEVSIQRYHKYCLNDPWGACLYDDRYENARHESCLNNPFPTWCVEDGRYDDVRHEHCLNNPFDTGCAGDDRYQDARTAEICSDKDVASLWQSPCDNDSASIQRRHEACLNNPFGVECYEDDSYDDARHEHCLNNSFDGQCVEDYRYQNARLEACAVDFRNECADGGLEFYPALIKFCNKPANAGHDACVVPSKPQVDSAGDIHNQFLQGTADGLDTGSLRASTDDATAPVVHTLKLSDSDDGVAFFGGIKPDGGTDYAYYAGILPKNNLGAPITQTNGTAVWQGTFSVIEYGEIRRDTDFDLEIDFAEKQLSASINGGEWNEYSYLPASNYRLSGVFTEGKIEGDLHVTYDSRNYGHSWVVEARVKGLIGQDGAIGAFVGHDDNPFSGGFVARPPSE